MTTELAKTTSRPNLPSQYEAAERLEHALGSPLHAEGPFSFLEAMRLDEADAFPQAAVEALERLGFHHYYVPETYGGKLGSFEQLLALFRVVSRRDLTAAIGHGKTVLGSMAVWLGGEESQKRRLAERILSGQAISLALTERAHGSDLLASDTVAIARPDGYELAGEKWLINNANRSSALTVFARTDEKGGARGFSLFLVEKEALAGGTFECLPRVKTHGIRGADISGIRFEGCMIPAEALVGRPGMGLELTLKLFQVTRTMCAGLSLGAADSALRITFDFAAGRKLYSDSMLALPLVRTKLVGAYLDLLIADAVSTLAARALHHRPRQMMLLSSIAKYFVPTTLERAIADLSTVLGARYYLREAHDMGVFQKLLRDSALVSLFDGSTAVTLSAIAGQLRSLARRRQKLGEAAAVPELFDLWAPLPPFEPARLDLFGSGHDDILQGLRTTTQALSGLSHHPATEPGVVQAIIERVEALLAEADRLDQAVLGAPDPFEKSPEAYALAQRYCELHAAAACVQLWQHNLDRLEGFYARGHWLVLCLDRLLRPERYVSGPDDSLVFEHLCDLHRGDRMFSLFPLQLAWGHSPRHAPSEA